MNKSTFITALTLAFCMLISININAQEFPELDKSPMDAASFPTDYEESKKLIKIIYSRPQLNGRTVEKLVPTGKVWRTGANEAAELTLYAPMMFGNKKLPAGTYTFYLLPEDNYWIAIINKDLNVWGSYFYNEGNDMARLKIQATKGEEFIEAFSIIFEEINDKGVMMQIGWGHKRLSIPFYSAF